MRSPKTLDVIKTIPEDRLLIESDFNSARPMEEELLRMCFVVSRLRNWTLHETANKTFQNAKRFFNFKL